MKKLTYIFAATMFMVACNNEELISTQNGENAIIKFNSNLNAYGSQVVSRLGETNFDENDEVALWANVSEGEAPFTGREILTANTDGILYSSNVLEYKDDNTVFFSALYPASLCTEDSKPSEITLDVKSDENGYQSLPDLIYATATGSTASPTVNFTFKRQLAKVCVAVKNEGVDLSDAEVFVRAKSGGIFNLQSLSVTLPDNAQIEDHKIPLTIVENFNGNQDYGSTIVAPQTLEGACIGIKLNDATETKYVSFPSIVLDSAKKYIFNITTRKIGEGDVEISLATGINEVPWISDDATEGEVEVDEIQLLNKCLKLTGRELDNEGKTQQTQAFYTFAETLPAGTYTLSCKIKSTKDITGGNLVLQPLDGWSSQIYGYPNLNTTSDWNTLSSTFTVSDDNANVFQRFFFQFNTNPEDYILVDDITLTKDGDTSTNYILNSDFSDGTTNGWSSYNGNVFIGEY